MLLEVGISPLCLFHKRAVHVLSPAPITCCSHTDHTGPSTEQLVTLTDEGLPIRPRQRPCSHYMRFGCE